MMRYLQVVLPVLLSLGTLSASCNKGKEHPCKKVCAKVEECWGEDGLEQCLEQCPAMVEQVEQDGYDAQAVADCVVAEASCMDFASTSTLDAIIQECAGRQDVIDAGTDPETDPTQEIPPGYINASEACTQIGHAYCNRRDDCLGERPPDVAHCRNDVNRVCEGESGTVLESEVETCVDRIDSGGCDAIFDASGNPIVQPGCPEF